MNELIHEEVMVISTSYEILNVNDSLLKKLGLTREETIGKHCFEISHHQDVPCRGENHPCPLRETLRTIKSSQATHVHFDKEAFSLLISDIVMPETNGLELLRLVKKQ